MTKNKKIIILGGDPNSINSEIIYKSWKSLNNNIRKKIFIIANHELLKKQFKKLNYSIKVKKIENLEKCDYQSEKNSLKVLDVYLKFKDPYKIKKKIASRYVKKCLDLGHKLALNNKIAGLINCAINKNLLKKNMGVTEYLSKKCKLKNNSEVMLIKSNNFSVSPITTHLDLRDVSKNIKSKIIVKKIKTIQEYYLKIFKFKPKIGVLGLNPHNAEFRKDSEELNEIIPAIKKLKKKSIKVDGPLVADTVFIKNFKKYDVIVGMYHDQVLSPFKSIFKFDAINITLGLKYLRVSPDHGVGVDLIRKNKANATSLLKCIKFINNLR